MPEPDRGPPCAPPAAVSTRARKQLRGPGSDIGDRSGQESLGFADIGAPTQQFDWKSDRRAGRQPRDRGGPPQVATERLRIFAHQHGDRVAVRCDQRLEGLDVGFQCCDLALGQRHVQFVGQPAIEAGLGQIEHLARGLDLAIENLKAILPGPQIKVQTGDVGGDHDVDPVARFLECLRGIGLRLDAACDLAEHVDLPFGVETADLS